MRNFKITLKNYRPFANHQPIEFEITDGITFVLGVNNVGKSALFRAFYELRSCINDQFFHGNKTGAFSTSLPKKFDQLAHRATPNLPISLTIDNGTIIWKIVIHPQSAADPHQVAVRVESTISGTVIPEAAEAALDLFRRSLYISSFRSPTSLVTESLYDIQIGRGFITQWDSWANGTRIDQSNHVETLIEELRSLFGFTKFSISVSQDKSQLYIITDDGRFSLDELGDGLSHYIIVLGNAMVKHPAYIFIDEPEIGLHPKLQEVFVRTLATKASHGVLATSHSVGLARSTADQIVMLTRNQNGRRVCQPFGENREESLIQSIYELGYSQYAEIGGNHLLLVEGRTDIKAYREILRKFHIEHHYLIWSLNGSDWTRSAAEKIADELSELKRLNAKSISVIIDSERTEENGPIAPHLASFLRLCEDLGFKTFATDRHSTENYISQAALDTAEQGYQALGPFESFSKTTRKWEKSKNWLFFQKMNSDEFNGTGLKEFIEKVLSTQCC